MSEFEPRVLVDSETLFGEFYDHDVDGMITIERFPDGDIMELAEPTPADTDYDGDEGAEITSPYAELLVDPSLTNLYNAATWGTTQQPVIEKQPTATAEELTERTIALRALQENMDTLHAIGDLLEEINRLSIDRARMTFARSSTATIEQALTDDPGPYLEGLLKAELNTRRDSLPLHIRYARAPQYKEKRAIGLDLFHEAWAALEEHDIPLEERVQILQQYQADLARRQVYTPSIGFTHWLSTRLNVK
jgi:hypothetical protein